MGPSPGNTVADLLLKPPCPSCCSFRDHLLQWDGGLVSPIFSVILRQLPTRHKSEGFQGGRVSRLLIGFTLSFVGISNPKSGPPPPLNICPPSETSVRIRPKAIHTRFTAGSPCTAPYASLQHKCPSVWLRDKHFTPEQARCYEKIVSLRHKCVTPPGTLYGLPLPSEVDTGNRGRLHCAARCGCTAAADTQTVCVALAYAQSLYFVVSPAVWE